MSFKDAIQIDRLLSISNEISSHLESIEEFGHVVVATSEHDKLKERSEKLQLKLQECNDELDKLSDEMRDWYSY